MTEDRPADQISSGERAPTRRVSRSSLCSLGSTTPSSAGDRTAYGESAAGSASGSSSVIDMSSGASAVPADILVSQSTTRRSDVLPDGRKTNWVSRDPRSSSRAARRFSGSTAASSASEAEPKAPLIGRIGVCALDAKARSKPSRNILTRLQPRGEFEVIVFGDKVILDEDVENWPICDFLISFFSDGFPLDKAIAYAHLRKPFCINDLPMQQVLWDRRLCLRILDQMKVPTPKRLEVDRDGGPRFATPALAKHVHEMSGLKLQGPPDGTGGGIPKPKSVSTAEDGNVLIVDGKMFRKPFVEKPVNGEDHNVHIYFAGNEGGRKLFRKVGNKSSEFDPDLKIPRSVTDPNGSYIYEQFLRVDNAEDVKAYTVGTGFCHAETRKSPVVDGLVRRNTHGKELRYITKLSKEEATMAANISIGFGQRICGFDLLRVGDKSYVIDVNGWSFVKDNEDYYDKCAKILRQMFINERRRQEDALSPGKSAILDPVSGKEESSRTGAKRADNFPGSTAQPEQASAPPPASKHSWKLKGVVAVIRHADRTPKQKFKFTFHTQPFIDLLKGHQEEVVIKGPAALRSVSDAVDIAMKQGIESQERLTLLKSSLEHKGGWPGTKVQIKPMFRKRDQAEIADKRKAAEQPRTTESAELEQDSLVRFRSESVSDSTFSRFSAVENDLILDKLQLVIKWGGEPTHAARYQSQDVGLNMRNDLKLMNKEALNDVRIYTSSEQRVSTSAQIFTSAFLNREELPKDLIKVRKDLLDDSNAAKDVMDKVKKKLKLLLREGNSAPPQFAWPKENFPEPSVVLSTAVDLMKFHRRVMRHNFALLKNSMEGTKPPEEGMAPAIQNRWCAGEDPYLFKERWEKLFAEFCDTEKVDPSKISELYDSMKFDALHNRQFLEWIFMPPDSFLLKEQKIPEQLIFHSDKPKQSRQNSNETIIDSGKRKGGGASGSGDGSGGGRRAEMAIAVDPSSPSTSYFKLDTNSVPGRVKTDQRLIKLRTLYQLAKVLFDFVSPQEYGIEDSEKLEIGLLTSLPLLQEIVTDLEEVQASPDAKSFLYFTKESHIYTLLNCILEGGIQTKIARRAIPELDYFSQICFELYEANDAESATFSYSIRISISPGCHTFDPLDVQLDSKHAIGCAPRRSLTPHQDWKTVIETLKAKFNTVKLPQSFLAVNLSDKHAGATTE